MALKNLKYTSYEDLLNNDTLINVERAWKTSVEHQIKIGHQPEAKDIIKSVIERIKTNL